MRVTGEKRRQLGQLEAPAIQERGGCDVDGIGPLAAHRFKSGIDSSARRQVIEAGALASAMRRDLGVRWLNGEPVDVGTYSALCNAERRQYEAAGALNFAPKDVTPRLSEYLVEATRE